MNFSKIIHFLNQRIIKSLIANMLAQFFKNNQH